MRVLFVSSGNSINGISPIVRRQGDSLSKEGLEVFFFTIRGRGFKGYLNNLWRLKNYLKEIQPDIIHAHYSMSAFLATLAGGKPLIVSLMGSDVKVSTPLKTLIKLLIKFFWCHTIVKSVDMRNSIGLNDISVIPNGVDTRIYYPMDKSTCQKELGWSTNKKHILFGGNPSRAEKNFALASQALDSLINENIEIHTLIDVSPENMPVWLNASDVLILTSLWEGSPNVIKEAMACNCPAVATNVGDIEYLFGKEPGYFLTGFTVYEISEKIKEALSFSINPVKTNGRHRIINLGLDSATIALKIIQIYQTARGKE